jgi:hypothetical protein
VVAQPWRRAGKLGIPSGLCVAPLRLGGLRGKQSTPSDWLGGTGVVSTVGEQERHGASLNGKMERCGCLVKVDLVLPSLLKKEKIPLDSLSALPF